jgi:hypothetical protein
MYNVLLMYSQITTMIDDCIDPFWLMTIMPRPAGWCILRLLLFSSILVNYKKNHVYTLYFYNNLCTVPLKYVSITCMVLVYSYFKGLSWG